MKYNFHIEYIFFILFISFIISSIYYIEKQATDINNTQCHSVYCYEER
jgi:hypothetical protein|nr:MAG TPA: hypothetical protein [Caudoviricetes sp.]